MYFFPTALTVMISPGVPEVVGRRKFPLKLIIYCYIYSSPQQGQSTCCFIGASELRAEALLTTDGGDTWEPGMELWDPALQDKHVHLPLLVIT